ncbi:MAG: AI-2E family transporter [Aquimonas sp.]|jgi:predicted PurR-regulated permease PerM|nr:AI-2E family transporter [Aquimonas sp.]
MTDTQKWQLLALTVVLSAFLYLLAPVLTPFAAAALFAYLGDPLVDRLQTWRLSRTAAVAVVFALMTLAVVSVVLLLIPMLQKQIVHFGERFPVYLAWFETVALPWLEQQSGFDLDRLQVGNLLGMVKQYWQQAGSAAATVFGGLSRSGMAVLEFVANLTLIPVVTFYLLRDWDGMVARIRELLPRAIEPTVVRLANESDAVLGSFLRGQVSVMLALGTIYTLGLSLVGIDLALLIGMLAGLVSFVPYLGVIVGFGAGLIAALVQHGDLFHVLLVAGVFGFGQIIEGFVLTPWLVGDKIGMHPVAVIFAIMAGGQLFGFLGVLLALPVAAVIMVVLRWLHERYTQSSLYGAAERAVEDALIHEVARADVAPSALTASDAPQDAADKPPIANA